MDSIPHFITTMGFILVVHLALAQPLPVFPSKFPSDLLLLLAQHKIIVFFTLPPMELLAVTGPYVPSIVSFGFLISYPLSWQLASLLAFLRAVYILTAGAFSDFCPVSRAGSPSLHLLKLLISPPLYTSMPQGKLGLLRDGISPLALRSFIPLMSFKGTHICPPPSFGTGLRLSPSYAGPPSKTPFRYGPLFFVGLQSW